MCPVFFKYGSFEISSWAIIYVLSILIGLYFSARIDEDQKLQIGRTKLLILWVGVIYFAGLIGSKLFQMFVLWSSSHPLNNSGKAFYGGMIAVIILAILLARIWRLSVYKTLDILLLAGCLSGSIARIGCLLNGCCQGDVVHNCLFAIKYPHINALFPTCINLLFGLRWHEFTQSFEGAIPVYPIPIIYSFGFMLIFIYLYTKRKLINQSPGTIFYMGLLLHGGLRIGLEAIRNNPPYIYGKFNVSGVLSILSILIGFSVLVFRNHKYVADFIKRITITLSTKYNLIRMKTSI